MRRKGHDFERRIARELADIGYNTRTTRAASGLLDSCGIDIVGTPFLVQCKAGYKRNRPKFEEEYDYIQQRLNEEFPPGHPIHDFPTAIIHNLDIAKGRGHKRTERDTYVMITFDTFKDLLRRVSMPTLDIM